MINLKLPLLAISGLCAASSFAQGFYGGDIDRVDGIASGNNMAFDSTIYDNFTVSGPTWNVTSLGGDFFVDTTWTSALWEIRSGAGVNNGGTIVASGSIAATSISNGTLFNLDWRTYTLDVADFSLAAGNYHLGISLTGNGGGSGVAYAATTQGVNGIGGPLNDGNALWDSTSFSASFEDVTTSFGSPHDFAYRVNAQAVPEPATMAALGLGALALIRRKRKQA